MNRHASTSGTGYTPLLAQAYARLEEDAHQWSTEEEVRASVLQALTTATGVYINAERGREDASYNNVIIEFKAPGLFKGTKLSAKFIEARDERLLKYVKRRAAKEQRPQEEYIGIMFDGDHFCFATVKDDNITAEHLLPRSEYSFMLVAQALKADLRRPVTSEALLTDFGHSSSIARDLMQALADALADGLASNTGKIPMLFQEWRALYGQVADLSTFQMSELSRQLAFQWKGRRDYGLSASIFVIHTYNSLLVKLLAAEIVSAYQLTSQDQPAQYMATLDNDGALRRVLQSDIEHSGIFADAGIAGFVEEVIFSWYLDMMDKHPSLGFAIREVLATLSLYRAGSLAGTRDVLRDVYQGLVPGMMRKSLGEYYTPDWLVDFTLSTATDGPWMDQRVIDPTCGSGSFLLGAIARKRQEAVEAGRSAEQMLEDITSNCWGIDLNPLAVQISRVNYLMAIADLLSAARLSRDLEIPILMADAIYSPAAPPEGSGKVVEYSIGSVTAGLTMTIPAALAFNRLRLDEVLYVMGLYVEEDKEYAEVDAYFRMSKILTDEEAVEFYAPLSNSYDQVLNLHRKNWNGIWFKIVRNFFWSATAGTFDIVVGNPPWVRWSRLPEAYRERVKPTCDAYGIFSETKWHGGNELDVSAIVTYAVADKWLAPSGSMSLVLTGTLLKNPSSSGFRNFILRPEENSSPRINPTQVHDFKAVKPFKDAANHAIVVHFEKTDKDVTYPVPYSYWTKASRNQPALGVNDSLDIALAALNQDTQEAYPVLSDVLGSPWSVLPAGRHTQLSPLVGTTEWATGRKGITADLNGVYFVRILNSKPGLLEIQSRPEAGKKDIGPSKRAWVEDDMLYPLIKGASDFEACYVKADSPNFDGEHLYTFVPNCNISPGEYDALRARLQQPKFKRTARWFAGYKELLLKRSTYKRQMKGAPYSAVYNVGKYTFKPWKVVFPEMGKVKAAVVGSRDVPGAGPRPVVPDHKIYYAAFDDEDTAMYLCGLMNNPAVAQLLESYLVSIQMGDILKNLSLPEFNSSQNDHVELVALVKQAHVQHDAKKRRELLREIVSISSRILNV